MTTDFPKVWTPAQIAEVTQASVDDVLVEIKEGRLPAFRIGSEPRVTDAAFRAFMAGSSATDNGNRAAKPAGTPATGGPATAKVEWKPRAKFSYIWPDGTTKETYDTAFEADVPLASGQRHFVIGYTKRKAAGRDRQRVIVFLGEVPKVVPVVEFTGTNDFAQSRHVASVIKDPSNKHARSQSQLPAEYQGMPTVIYSDVVVGLYAARSIAVLADNDDRDLMLRHAIIRARYKGMIED